MKRSENDMGMCFRAYVTAALLAVLVMVPATYAQPSPEQKREAREYARRHYQTDFWDVDNSSLLQGTVQSIAQSPDGFLWLATQGGLARFDGIEFAIYHSQEHPEIGSDVISDIEVAGDSTVWCATSGGGIFAVKNGMVRGISARHGLTSDWMQDLVASDQWGIWYRSSSGIGRIVDSTASENWGLGGSSLLLYGEHFGSFWAGTQKGLFRFTGEEWEPVSFGGVEFGLAYDLMIDSTGRFWIAAEQGLFSGHEYDLRLDKRLRMPVRALARDKRGRVWVCTYDRGLYCVDGESIDHYGLEDGLGSNNIRWTFEDKQGTIWICDEAGGLSLVTPKGVLHPQVDEFLFGRAHVRTVLEDVEGNIWFGTYAGLARVKSRRVRMITTDDGLQAPLVWSLAEASNGDMFVGTNKGLSRIRNGRVVPVPGAAALPGVPIMALKVDQRNTLWIGTLGEGLWSWQGGRFQKRFPASGYQAPRVIRSIEFVGKDSALIATSGRPLLLNTRHPLCTVLQTDTSSGQILTTHRDREGRLWLGMGNGIVKEFRLDRSGMSFRLPLNADRYALSYLVTGPDGTILCSTLGGGLVKIREGVSEVLEAEGQRLPAGKYNWVAQDHAGGFWIGTNKGVANVSAESLEQQGSGPAMTRMFGTSDGLSSTETVAWTQSPVILRNDGTLWFGTLKGVAIVDVRNVGRNTIPPPSVIDRIVVNGESHPVSGSIELPAGNNDLEFHYTAPSLAASEKNQYRYRLDGYDIGWIDAKTRRVAYYTNVPPGTYRFMMQASNNDGVWSERNAAMTLSLQPYFYQTVWFYALGLLAVFGLGVAAQKMLWRYRNERDLAERLQMRLEASQLRALRMQLHPHFLFNTLNAISSMILTKPRKAVMMIGKLSEMLRISLEKEQIQFTTLREEMEFLNRYLSFEQIRFGNRLSVAVHIEDGVERALIPTFLLQPLVENAIKHGFGNQEDKGTISVDAIRVNGHLQIQVRDNGQGVSGAEAFKEGVGLSNTRSRLQQLYGDRFTLTLSSDRKKGFIVGIGLPLEFEHSAGSGKIQ